MMRFKIKFSARKRGAIGIHSTFVEVVEAPSFDDARLKLYADYDHIHSDQHVRLMFAPTYVNADGLRVLMQTNQGRFHYETRAGAQAWLDAIMTANTEEQIKGIWGPKALRAFEVREIECYDHGDAARTVFE